MPSFVQYHNGSKLGWVPLDEQPFRQTCLAIYTRRSLVRKAIGGTVYLIVSLGQPRRYYLWECFRITEVREEAGQFCALGPGWQLAPPQRLHGPAFQAFHRSCGYFIGFQNIDAQPYLAELQRLAEAFRKECADLATLAFCEELVGSLPQCGDSYYYRGMVRRNLGQWAEALTDFEQAERLGTEFLQAARQQQQQCRAALQAVR